MLASPPHVKIKVRIEKKTFPQSFESKASLYAGTCIQRKFGGHRCDCTGTGFHGQACQIGEKPKELGQKLTAFQDMNVLFVFSSLTHLLLSFFKS